MARGLMLLGLAACGEGPGGAGPGTGASSLPPSTRGDDGGRPIERVVEARPSPTEAARPAPEAEFVVRDHRARARVEMSSEAPRIVVGGARYALVGPDGSLDRGSVDRLLDGFEAAGTFLEVELLMPREVPGAIVEQLVFYLEEKGKVPILTAPEAVPESSPEKRAQLEQG